MQVYNLDGVSLEVEGSRFNLRLNHCERRQIVVQMEEIGPADSHICWREKNPGGHFHLGGGGKFLITAGEATGAEEEIKAGFPPRPCVAPGFKPFKGALLLDMKDS